METWWLNKFQGSNFSRQGVVFMCFNSSCDQKIIGKKKISPNFNGLVAEKMRKIVCYHCLKFYILFANKG